IARHFGTEHTEYYVSNNDMLDKIETLPFYYDEPFADSSALPTMIVAELAKNDVTVALSADGGDEVFCGYSKYFMLQRFESTFNNALKKGGIRGLLKLFNERQADRINSWLPKKYQATNIQDKFSKFKRAMSSESLAEMFCNASSYVDATEVRRFLKIEGQLFNKFDFMDDLSFMDNMMLTDYQTFMVDDVLTKVDRACMSVSLEGREPLLDHRIVEFMAQVPLDVKYKNKQGKYLARQILYKHIPKTMIDKPKAGFQIPLVDWMLTELKPLVEKHVNCDHLDAEIFNVEEVLHIKKSFYYNKIALRNATINKDTSAITLTLNRMGVLYNAKDKLDSAKIYYRKVIHYYPLTSKTENKHATAYNNLGTIAGYQNDLPLAKYYAKKSLEIREKQKDSIGISYTILNIGNISFWQEDYKDAINNYLKVMTMIKNDSTDKALVLKRRNYENIAIAYDSLGDYEKAYRYLVEYRYLSEEINENVLANKFTETEAKYNLARADKHTAVAKGKALRTQLLFYGLAFLTLIFFILIIIFYKNYKLREQNKLEHLQNNIQTRIINATIDAKEKERKNIAEILHDSVSALLSSANLHLQASKAQLNSKTPVEIEKAQQIVTEASGKIRDLSHTLISSILLKFGLGFAVQDLCEKYSNSKFTLITDDKVINRYNQKFEIKIYNIIEELINNIIKHSSAENASIILTEKNDSKLIIQIIDDGIGFDVKKVRNKDGLGLSHIEARIKVMKGVFNINSKKGEGTSIFISTPIYMQKMVEKS
ncbi:MAG: asparagine synthase-related protein, partial [Flavobacteriaceae bacterium]|nr:asparagine synthase-related protein [Flavobacteriaceae bacterium]